MATNIEVRVVDKTATALKNISNRLDGLNKGLFGINRVAGLAATAIGAIGGTSIIKNIVNTTSRFEDLRTTLKSVTGSAEAGAEAFAFIQDFSTRTQFGIEDLSKAFVKLKAAGIEPTEKLLTTFTDTAAVTTDQIGTLEAVTDLFARTVSGGLNLEQINRLADRGVPVLAILEEQLGLTRNQLTEFGKTAEGAKKITDAFAKGIQEKFGGATQNVLNNLSTRFSNLQIALGNAADKIGNQGFGKALGETVVEITDFIIKNDELVVGIGKNLTKAFLYAKESMVLVLNNLDLLAKAFGIFFGLKIGLGIAAIATAFAGKLVRAIILTTQAMKALAIVTARHPLIAGAMVIAIGINKLTGVFDKLAESFLGLADDALGKLGDEMNKVLDIIDENVDGFDEYLGAIHDIANETGAFIGYADMLDEKLSLPGALDSITRLEQEMEDANGTIDNGIKSATKFEGSLKDAFSEANKGAREAIENFNSLKAVQDLGTMSINTFRQGVAEAFADAVLGAKTFAEGLRDVARVIARQLIVGVAELVVQFFILDKFVKPFLERIANGTKNTTNEQKKLNRELGVELGLRAALSFFTGGFGIPFFAEGGRVQGNRPIIVGEKGPELFVPPSSGQIIPNNRLDDYGGGTDTASGGVNVNFHIQTVDARGFDELLLTRRGLITSMINDSLARQGKEALA